MHFPDGSAQQRLKLCAKGGASAHQQRGALRWRKMSSEAVWWARAICAACQRPLAPSFFAKALSPSKYACVACAAAL